MPPLTNHRNIWLIVAGIALLAVGLAFRFVDVIIAHVGATVIIAALVLGGFLFLLPSAKDRQWRFVAYFAILLVFLLVYSGSKDYTRRYADNMSDGLKKGFGLDRKKEQTSVVRSENNNVPTPNVPSVQPVSEQATFEGSRFRLERHSCSENIWEGAALMEGREAIVAPVRIIGDLSGQSYRVHSGWSYQVCANHTNENLLGRWFPKCAGCTNRDGQPRADVMYAFLDGSQPEPIPAKWTELGVKDYITEEAFQQFFAKRQVNQSLPYHANGGEVVAVIYDDGGNVIGVERPFKPDLRTLGHRNWGEFTSKQEGMLKFEVNTPFYRGYTEPTQEELREGGLSRGTIYLRVNRSS